MDTYLLIPLEDTVVFPNMNVTLPIDVGDEQQVLLVPTHECEADRVGVGAEVDEVARLPRGVTAVSLNALHRAVLGAAESDSPGRLRVAAESHADGEPRPLKTRARGRRTRPGCGLRERPASSSSGPGPWSSRSSSCAATTPAWPRSCARSP